MEAKARIYVPHAFRNFQGFSVVDVKESIVSRQMELWLRAEETHRPLCSRCGGLLGAKHDHYRVRARHMRCFDWTVTVVFFRSKHWCPHCRKTRSELIEWLCPTSPHMTMELAWWLNRMSEVTSVLAVSRLESVDEVYARSPKQMAEDENRDDLFLTVIVDQRTHKVIWVSQSRRKEALDQFFELLGPERCKDIEVVATDQHDGYAASVEQYCPQATLVWDRFHLVQKFNEALNEERKAELAKIDPEGAMGDLMNGKYRHLFLTKAKNRSKLDSRHIDEVLSLNSRMAKLELIKEHFHRMFETSDVIEAQVMLGQCYEWAFQCKAIHIVDWIWRVMDQQRFWNYWSCRLTTGVSEGINRAIKGLKWQAYGYKNMAYFALKIMQKCGYLNHRMYRQALET